MPFETHKSSWTQLNIEFAVARGHAGEAGPLFEGLVQQLASWRERGPVHWWFVRKQPGLRLRVGGPGFDASAARQLDALMATEREAGRVRACWRSCYEPECDRLGGPALIDALHALFSAESDIWQRWKSLPETQLRRGWIALLLYADLVAQATEDGAEAWDVWASLHRTYLGRPPGLPSACERGALRVALIRRLASPAEAELIDAALAAHTHFAEQLAQAERSEQLVGGRRALVGELASFHWNRWGLPLPSIAAFTAAMVDELHPARPYLSCSSSHPAAVTTASAPPTSTSR